MAIRCKFDVAKIDVYTRDASISLHGSVVNPKVGGCFGTNLFSSRTKKQTFTFGCIIDDNVTDKPLDGLCTDDTDCCEGSFSERHSSLMNHAFVNLFLQLDSFVTRVHQVLKAAVIPAFRIVHIQWHAQD